MAAIQLHSKPKEDSLPGFVEFNEELDNPEQGGCMAFTKRVAGAGTIRKHDIGHGTSDHPFISQSGRAGNISKSSNG